MPDISNTSANTEKPTMEQYEEVKHELQELLSRKKQVDQNLTKLEQSIYMYEGNYLEDTQQYGNIIRGFEGYLGGRAIAGERRRRITDADRLFSMSSTTFAKAIALRERDDDDSSDDRSSIASRGVLKKKKTRVVVGSGGERKRLRLSLGRDTEEELDV
ncbi:uncharacterized protein VTP21DRAFT_6138 [Calcarisporiella thermophila]|uniref:uncharacterized protein n=1 Tax=Calcarisporiella thermophila TaxID=911321 RepID=UPI0037437D64